MFFGVLCFSSMLLECLQRKGLKSFKLELSIDIYVEYILNKNRDQYTYYRVRHNHGNTHFMIVLDEKQSNLKICWIC